LVLFGLPFHDVTMTETLAWIDDLIASRRAAYFVTANLDFAAQASKDVELQRILVEAELVLCDGTPLVWASRLAGKPLRERVAGSDLVPQLAAHAEQRGYKIFLLGSEPAILEKAAENLGKNYPKLPPVKCYSPPFASLLDLDHAGILERLEEARPDILLVAFGCPKQEKLISMHYRALGIPCSIGVGATVDFLAGKVSRAPAWMAKSGLEWVFRLSQEPKRLVGRYWNDICFLISQSWNELRVARATRALPPPKAVEIAAAPGLEVLSWNGALSADGLDRLPRSRHA
jgi:N-acetylglucosaminyldiphosphoundecaprenol N-acetyl-beta-D-mannosaminyltransferase